MPNTKKFAVKNGLQSQNIDFISPNENNVIQVTMLDTGTLAVSGNSGQLFSITDSMTGSIFAVNDISGVPSIEVFDTGTVQIAETFGNVLIGTSANTGAKLQVNGAIAATSLSSNVATGTAPLTVASSTAVTNLNADLLDSQHGSYYTNATNLSSGTVSAARLPQATTSSNGAVVLLDSVSNTSTSIYAPTMNAVKTAYDAAITANNNAANASVLSSGTVAKERLPAFTGDATAPAGTANLTLIDTGVVAGLYGNASSIPAITVDSKGRITNIASTAVAGVSNYAYTPANNTFTITTSAGGSYNATIGAVNAFAVTGGLTVTGNTTITGAASVSSTLQVDGAATFSSNVTIANTMVAGITFTTSSVAQVAVDSFSSVVYRTAKYLVQMTSGASYHAIELLAIHDGTTVLLSQYGEVYTGNTLGTFDASISAGTLSLLFTATNAVTAVKMSRTLITL